MKLALVAVTYAIIAAYYTWGDMATWKHVLFLISLVVVGLLGTYAALDKSEE